MNMNKENRRGETDLECVGWYIREGTSPSCELIGMGTAVEGSLEKSKGVACSISPSVPLPALQIYYNSILLVVSGMRKHLQFSHYHTIRVIKIDSFNIYSSKCIYK